MRSVSDFIERLGGATSIALFLSTPTERIPATTVASWKSRNSIPVEHWPRLMDLAREREVRDCDYATLVGLHVPQNEQTAS